MKYILIMFALLPLLGANLMAQEIGWETKLEVATAKAAAEKTEKFVLLHFTAEWCRPCQQLDTFVFRNSMVQAAIRDNVVPIRIDVDAQPELAKEYGVISVPYDVVLTASGRILSSRKSPLDSFGYARMLSMLKRMEANSNSSANSGVQRQIDELREKFQPKRFIAKDDGFTPTAPMHTMPGVTREGRDLQRKNAGVKVITNPFFDPAKARSNVQVGKANTDSGIRIADADANASNSTTRKPMRIANPNFVAAEKSKEPEEEATTLPWEENGSNQDTGAFVPPTKRAVVQAELNPASRSAKSEQELKAPSNSAFQAPKLIAETESPKRRQAESELELPGFEPSQNDSGTGANSTMEVAKSPDNGVFPTKTPPVETSELPSESATAIGAAGPKIVFGLKKKCPVTLATESRWEDGNEEWGCVHRGVTYLFASKEKLKRFQLDPDKYSPLLAGYDPVSFHESGELNFGQEDFGVFMGKAGEQQIVLFASAKNRDKFKTNPRLYLDTVRVATTQADTNSIR